MTLCFVARHFQRSQGQGDSQAGADFDLERALEEAMDARGAFADGDDVDDEGECDVVFEDLLLRFPFTERAVGGIDNADQVRSARLWPYLWNRPPSRWSGPCLSSRVASPPE